jgi:hypothetical protein
LTVGKHAIYEVAWKAEKVNKLLPRRKMAATESTAIKMTKAEDVLGEKWDRCLVDTGIKMTSGLAIGKLNKI